MAYKNTAIEAARAVVVEDIHYCEQAYVADPLNQVARRNLIRAEFAFIDAGLHVIKYMGAGGDEHKIPQKTPAKEGMINAYDNLADKLKIPIKFKRNNAGWDAMTKAIKIRDRITHPKKPSDLVISDSDMKIFKRAVEWFATAMVEIKSVVENNLCTI